jgi:hypothetical protein
MAKALADAENSARYQNYATERGYQNDAIGQAQQLMGGSQGLLNNAAELPWIGVGALNGNVRNASGGYGTQTSVQKQGVGGLLAQAAGTALGAFAGSDIRLKTNVEKVGETPDGLNVIEWDYIDEMPDGIAAYCPS